MSTMNYQQQQVEKQLLLNEKAVLKELEQNYVKALADVKRQIKRLSADELTKSKIYQIEYQQALQNQIEAILNVLGGNNITTINEYLKLCYEDGFIGNMYGVSGYGLDMVLPINQRLVAQAITQSADGIKLSKRLYEDITQLQKEVKDVIARGLASNQRYTDMATQLTLHSEANMRQAFRIARTEGGRVQSLATLDSTQAMISEGADLIKQWDSTMDGVTRKSHVKLDGQVREVDEAFEVNGHSGMAPRLFGIPSEDINCRCCVLTRPRWALEAGWEKRNQETGKIVNVKGKTYHVWKKHYYKELEGE